MNDNHIFEKLQSGFHSRHGTETALVKVANDLLLAADSGLYSVLILLDLSSAFDTVDHNVVISCLKNYAGISDVALDWFISYLANRSFSVRLREAPSSCAPLFCGVPQGSILGPLLFSVCLLPLGQIMHRHNIDFHCYADDMQLYVPLQPGKSDVSRIFSCLAEIENWMSESFLHLNDSKSGIVIMSPSGPSTSNITDLSSSLGALSNNVQKEVRNLGVIIDSELSFDTQVTKVVQSCFAQLRQLTKIRSFLSSADLEKVKVMLLSPPDWTTVMHFTLVSANETSKDCS